MGGLCENDARLGSGTGSATHARGQRMAHQAARIEIDRGWACAMLRRRFLRKLSQASDLGGRRERRELASRVSRRAVLTILVFPAEPLSGLACGGEGGRRAPGRRWIGCGRVGSRDRRSWPAFGIDLLTLPRGVARDVWGAIIW